MADTKVSALTALVGSGVATDDLFPVVDTSATTSKYITAAELINALDALSTFSKAAEVVLQTLADVKGDVIAATAADTWARVAAGTDLYALCADSTATPGIAYKNANSLPMEINAQTGTTYAPVLGDAGKLITSSNASAQTHTIPANATVAYPIGTVLNFMQLGAGQLTIAITSDTLQSTPGAKTRAQFSVVSAIKYLSTTWVLSGDLTA